MSDDSSLREVVEAAAETLRQAGVEAPLSEARVLLAHALGLPLSRLDLQPSVPGEAQVRFNALVGERASRRPLAYITGDTEFMGLRFLCDGRALVPRPETEVLVEQAVRRLREHDAAAVVLDIGTGTGAIGLSVAALLSEVRVVLTDVSAGALTLARENAALLGLADRARFLHGRDLDPILAAGLAEDITCVLANPPYVAPGDANALPPEVAEHEPREAWLGEDADGLGVYRRLIPQCARHLPNVWLLAFEVGLGQAEAVVRLWSGLGTQPTRVSVVKDLSDIDRVVVAERR
jgi:release factor glutamine methyltransferase